LALTRGEILVAAEDVLRRYGPAKASVVDVARALGVSHGSVYRHFGSKAALRDAVVERWLARGTDELSQIAAADAPAPERLARWLEQLASGKRAKAAADPELFATYLALAAESSAAVDAHVGHLLDELAAIIAAGVERGELEADDPALAARAVFDATIRFHKPSYAADWGDPGIEGALGRVIALVTAGLSPRSPVPRAAPPAPSRR
jgi:AcrR family transcriptional regulator